MLFLLLNFDLLSLFNSNLRSNVRFRERDNTCTRRVITPFRAAGLTTMM